MYVKSKMYLQTASNTIWHVNKCIVINTTNCISEKIQNVEYLDQIYDIFEKPKKNILFSTSIYVSFQCDWLWVCIQVNIWELHKIVYWTDILLVCWISIIEFFYRNVKKSID